MRDAPIWGFAHILPTLRADSARVTLTTTVGIASQEPNETTGNGRCGGCRDLGPHRNVPGCDYYTPRPTPSPDRETPEREG